MQATCRWETESMKSRNLNCFLSQKWSQRCMRLSRAVLDDVFLISGLSLESSVVSTGVEGRPSKSGRLGTASPARSTKSSGTASTACPPTRPRAWAWRRSRDRRRRSRLTATRPSSDTSTPTLKRSSPLTKKWVSKFIREVTLGFVILTADPGFAWPNYLRIINK